MDIVDGTARCHELVSMAIGGRMEPTKRITVLEALAHGLESRVGENVSTADWAGFMSQVGALVDQAAHTGYRSDQLTTILASCVRYLIERAIYGEAARLVAYWVSFNMQLNGDRSVQFAEALTAQAEVLYRLARLSEAQSSVETAELAYEESVGIGSGSALALFWKAWIILEVSSPALALEISLEARDRLIASGDLPTLLGKLDHQQGIIYWRLGQYGSSMASLTRYAESERVSSTQASTVGYSLALRELAIVQWEWALVTLDTDRLAAAKLDIERSLALSSSDDDVDLERARGNETLAVILTEMGELSRAKSLLESVVGARSLLLPDRVGSLEEHPSLAGARGYLGRVLGLMGDVTAALPIIQRAIDVHENRYGHADGRVAEFLTMYAEIQLAGGQAASARTTLDEAVNILHMSYPNGSPREVVVLRQIIKAVEVVSGDSDAILACRSRINFLVSILES